MARRRRAWEASKASGPVVAPLVLVMVRRRNWIAAARGSRDFFAMELARQEIDERFLFDILGRLEQLTAEPHRLLIERLSGQLSRRFGIRPEEVRPWHFADPFLQEAIPPEVDLAVYEGVNPGSRAKRSREWASAGRFSRARPYPGSARTSTRPARDVDRATDDVRVLCNLRPTVPQHDPARPHHAVRRELDPRSGGCARFHNPDDGRSRCSSVGWPEPRLMIRVPAQVEEVEDPRPAARARAARQPCSRHGARHDALRACSTAAPPLMISAPGGSFVERFRSAAPGRSHGAGLGPRRARAGLLPQLLAGRLDGLATDAWLTREHVVLFERREVERVAQPPVPRRCAGRGTRRSATPLASRRSGSLRGAVRARAGLSPWRATPPRSSTPARS